MNKSIPLALQLYSVRDEYRQNPDACLSAIAAMGYAGVEFFGPMDRTADALRDALRGAGLELVGWHTPIDWLMPDRLESTVKYMLEVGNPKLICPWLGEDYRSKAGLMSFAEYMTEIMPRLKRDGLRLGYHCHGFDMQKYGDITGWEIIADNTPADFIMQLDNGNCESGGGDSLGLLRKYEGRGATLHIKPYSKDKGYATMIGEDSIDWAATISEVRRQAVCEWLIVEYECEELFTQLEGARKCLQQIREILN